MRTALHHLVEERTHVRPDAPALTYRKSTVSYAELQRTVELVADGLLALGITREDRVAVFLEKRLETVAAFLGTSRARGVFVPVNPVLKPEQVAYILRDCTVRVLVTSRDRLDGLRKALVGTSIEHVVLVPADSAPDAAPLVVGDRVVEIHSWNDLVAERPTVTPPEVLDLDMAAILYTSGSTGQPKGVVLSHRNLIVGAESVSSYLDNQADDVILSLLPLSFDAGFSQLTTAFAVGAHVVLANYLLPRDVVRLCAEHKVTGLTCVPPLWFQIVAQEWSDEARASLRYFANTGGRMPRVTLDRLRALFPDAKPFLMYGLTEAFRSTYLDPDEVDRRPDSIGKAIPDAEILVLRPDGSPCAPGEEGELVHRGALVAMGYWNDAARTAERFRTVPGTDAPWRSPERAVWSGDVVVADEEGFLFFVGRSDDMIKTSGYRVSPAEVEEVAHGSGLVADAVAIGVPDEQLGQRIVLVVTSADGQTLAADALLDTMRRKLPLYMLPSSVLVRDAIQRSPNGKFDRVALREELTA